MTEDMLGAGVGMAIILAYLLFVFGVLFFIGLVAWKITAKTGYPGALGLLYFVPVANLVFLLILAFSEWPVHREMNSLKNILKQRTDATPQNPGNPLA